MKNQRFRRFKGLYALLEPAMIFQSRLPYDLQTKRPLPGITPLDGAPWFHTDEAYSAQMTRRESLIATQPDSVIATDAPSLGALEEMLDEVLAHLPDSFGRVGDTVIRPDGQAVKIDRDQPFHTLGHILQEDICLLEKRGEEHVLTGAVLCFPASWRLAEKIGHPLTHIHEPVQEYDADIARRVQRLFDGVRAGRAIWRFNALWYVDPELHQPRSAIAPRERTDPMQAPYLRSERQVIWRLPRTQAVLFTIHTYVIPRDVIALMQTT